MILPLLFALFASLVLGLPSQSLTERASILSPLNDPFYEPPDGWENKNPGDVLRSRKVDLAFLQVNKINYKEVYQVLYRTTGAYENDPATTVTTIIVPHNAQKNKLVNYLPYTDANGAKCAPSYSMRYGGDLFTDVVMTYQQLVINTLLDEGYILNVPDFQGKPRGFAAGRLNGRHSLDGVRAALNLDKVGLDRNAQVITYGYSGGAIASGWTAALQPSYAKELNCVGFVMGGTPANVTSTVKYLDHGFFAGFTITGTIGIMYTYDKLKEWAQPRLTAKGREAIEFVRSHCMLDSLSKFAYTSLQSNKYINNGTDLFDKPIVQSVVGDIVLGLKKSETPTAPVYMFHSVHDEVVPFRDAQNAAKQWVKNGADVRFDKFTDLFCGHVTADLTNIPNFVAWIKDRFDGKKVQKGLQYRTLSNPLVELDKHIPGVTDHLVKTIFNFIGREIGPSDSKFKDKIKNN